MIFKKFVKMNENRKIKKRHFLAFFAVFFAVILLASFLVMFSVEVKLREAKFDEIKTNEKNIIELEHSAFGEYFTSAISDFMFFQSITEKALADDGFDEDFIWQVSEFSYNKSRYSEMKFVDADGFEKFKIYHGNNNSYAVDEHGLYDVSAKDYFINAKGMVEKSIYVSPLELSHNELAVEVPYKPIIYISTPVFSRENDELLGVAVVSYLAKPMLNGFKNVAQNADGEVVLLNSNGDWLSSTLVSREWNFMFSGRSQLTFGYYYDEWEMIAEGNGQEVTDNGLFTFEAFDLYDELKFNGSGTDYDIQMGDGTLYVVSYILRTEETSHIFPDMPYSIALYVVKNNFYSFILTFLFCLLLTFLGYMYYKSYNEAKVNSTYDSLTGLYNRRMGTKRVEDILSYNDRRKMQMSLCFIDVNGLKEVNDKLGHKMGDELLVTVSGVIKDSIRFMDFAARMGGDEFIILFYGIGKEDSEKVWKRITRNFDRINREENRKYVISVSHGIVSCDKDAPSCNTDELIKIADELMYKEKGLIKKNLTILK